MKPSLQLKISQNLALTPQLQQSIRLLQLSTLELNQEIEQALLDNPMLERDESGSDAAFAEEADNPGEYADLNGSDGHEESVDADLEADTPQFELDDSSDETHDTDWINEGRSRGVDEDGDFQELQAAATSLREYLDAQIALMHLSERDRGLVRFLVEALDDNGYLTQSLEELFVLLPPELEIEQEELAIALQHLQHLDPPGIGARSVQECLRLQLDMKYTPENSVLAHTIVSSHLELLAAHDFVRLKRALECSDVALRQAQAQICSLNPRPGAHFAQLETRYVAPDVVVKKIRGQWTALLNQDALPKLRVHSLYAGILQSKRGHAGALSSQLQEAKWLIKNIQQRFDTILRVSQAIVERQRQFFDYGEVAMRPLTLREVADALELHESTVSRVTSQKYMATPRGVFELKYFFGSHVATDTGGACSATAIRALIRQLVGNEDRRKPLSDAKIADMLGLQGIMVARRTVAKYRESLNIPPVSQRKSI